jgi:uncharacterized protein (TIGR00730 family)
MRKICVFCGSSVGRRDEYLNAAARFGRELAARQMTLIYGGGRTGMMGAIADAALEGGGEVIGVIPQALATRELKHTGLSALHVVSSMHERKALMADLADAFVALPGGLGTFEELSEILTWSQLGLHDKPCGVLNVAGFYDPFLALLDHATEERFIRETDRALLLHSDDAETLLFKLERFKSSPRPRWIGPVES